MNAEIVMIGTELLLGQIADTNATHMAQVLAENGVNLFQKTTVGDNQSRIVRVLDEALNRANVVLTSGGLGPTEDDITRECVAEVTGRPLAFREDLFEQLSQRFSQMNRRMTANNRRQAYAPKDAQAIPNPNGTAPGLIVDDPRGVIICMPGVPRELYAMLADSVLPYLRQRYHLDSMLHYRVLHVCGVGESQVDTAIADLITDYDNPKIGLLASPESVRIRISARARTLAEADEQIDAVDKKIRQRLPGLVFGTDNDSLETVVDGLLAERGWTIALAETFTGGMVAQRLVAAGARQFAGAAVLPRSEQGPTAQTLHQELQRAFQSDCVLTLLAPEAGAAIQARFTTPDGAASWSFAPGRMHPLWQTRMAVTSLEYIRRHLLGIPLDDLGRKPGE